MIDNFALVLPHVLMALAIWRLLNRPDLDSDSAAAEDIAAPPSGSATPAMPKRRLRD